MKRADHIINNRYVYLFSRLIVGTVFIYAALPKILNPADFIIQVENYRLLPGIISYYLGIFLPWLELYSGLCILAGFWIRTNTILLSTMLAIFMIAISSAILRGLNIDCGCFSVAKSTNLVSLKRIIEDLILLLLVIFIGLNKNPILRLDKLFKRNN